MGTFDRVFMFVVLGLCSLLASAVVVGIICMVYIMTTITMITLNLNYMVGY